MIVDKTRVIGLSGRGKRLDKVLFAPIHEISHHTCGHVKDDAPIEVDDDPNDQSDEATQKREANDVAGR